MVNPGEVFVPGLTRANARRLLASAQELGLPSSVVRTIADGFLVPEEIVATLGEGVYTAQTSAAKSTEAAPAEPVEKPKRRTSRTKSDQTADSAGEG